MNTNFSALSARKTPRKDIQGLRALAVIAVVLYHAGVPHISGGFIGVDFFFVLSGFLITGLLVSELEQSGRISLSEFWGRRARRLIPASALVLIVTTLVASKVLPFMDRKAVAIDVLWASLFSANWRFANQQTDYLAADRSPSPVLHFWSLGVEEQFYFVAPLLFVTAAVFMWVKARRNPRRRQVVPRVFIALMLAAILVASLVYCVHETKSNQPFAFFGTPARAWQLAAGGLLALAVPFLTTVRIHLTLLASVFGSALLGGCVYFLSEGGSIAGYTYPSLLAVAPTLAAVLLLIGGLGVKQNIIARALGIRPLTFIGDISYSLYLWHWPFLVLGTVYLKDDSLTTKLLCVGAAFAASVLSYYLVENPIRNARTFRVTLKPAASMILGAALIAGIFPVATSMRDAKFQTIQAAPKQAKAVVIDDSINKVSPAVEKAPLDEGPLRNVGCQIKTSRDEVPSKAQCTFGSKTGKHQVIILGDSIGGAVFPALNQAGISMDWQVTAWLKSSCAIADLRREIPSQSNHTEWKECATWRNRVLNKTVAAKPDLVMLAISTGSLDDILGQKTGKRIVSRVARRAEAVAGLSRTIAWLQNAGLRVGLVESPNRSPFNMPECLIEKQSVSKCSFAPPTEPAVTAIVAKKFDDVIYVKINDRICDTKCRGVVGKKVVYRDALHYTTTFAKTLTPLFELALEQSS